MQDVVVTAAHARDVANAKRVEKALEWAGTAEGEKILAEVNDRINIAANEGKYKTTVDHSVLSSGYMSNLFVHFDDFMYLMHDIAGFDVEEIERLGGKYLILISWKRD